MHILGAGTVKTDILDVDVGKVHVEMLVSRVPLADFLRRRRPRVQRTSGSPKIGTSRARGQRTHLASSEDRSATDLTDEHLPEIPCPSVAHWPQRSLEELSLDPSKPEERNRLRPRLLPI